VALDVAAANDNTYCGPVPGGTINITGDFLLDTAVSFDP
jgi:hypothetical protein